MNEAPIKAVPFRTHHFSLAVCKHIFMHPTKGPIFVRDPIQRREAERYELSPLLVYALSIPGTRIRHMSFAPVEQPQPIYSTLHRLWAREENDFRGCPDAVIFSRQVASSCRNLSDKLACDGIEMIVAPKSDNVSGSILRSVQMSAIWIHNHNQRNIRIENIDQLNQMAAEYYRLSDYPSHVRHERELEEQWSALPCRSSSPIGSKEEMDWLPGSWLASWEAILPPISASRYFHNEDHDQKTWLLTGDRHNFSARGKDEKDDSEEELDDNQAWEAQVDLDLTELAKCLIKCWPNTSGQIAASIGITGRELNYFIAGRAKLKDATMAKLKEVLGIGWGHGRYDADGPCVLIAKDLEKAVRLYRDLLRGGDPVVFFEALPDTGEADPSWRYIVFKNWQDGINLFLFARGSKTADHLNQYRFDGFEGQRTVRSAVYRDIVSTAARASTGPLHNRMVMRAFGERHAKTYEFLGPE